jgi:putative oxidoreductase
MQLNSLLQSLVATGDSFAPLILRVALAVMLFPHGAQKLLGWFGGFGFTGSMGYFTGTVGTPWIVGFLVILGEFFGPLLLVAGFGTRFVAASIALIMLGAAWQVRGNGFFMNWFGNQKGEGFEIFILAVGAALTLVVLNGDKASVDSLLSR